MSKIEVNAIEPQCGTTLTVGAAGTTVTVPSNVVKSNALQASDAGNIISQSGTAITLGASGDSINLASGATQSGFGRTGTVDWQTGSIKTSTFTAANGEGYFANTSGGAFTMNLPAGVVGNIVSVVDYTNTFQTNNLTVAPNGSEKIGGVAATVALSTEGQSVTFVYVDATEGWKNVQDSTSNVTGTTYITATGGTPSQDGDYEIRTFTGPGTFCVSGLATNPLNNVVDYLVIAGGGNGSGASAGDVQGSGGGGAGGFRTSASTYSGPPLAVPAGVSVTAQGYGVTVGGAAGGSSVLGISSAAGGAGTGGCGTNGTAGGSGGGPKQGPSTAAGNTPSVSPPQGNPSGALAPSLRGSGGGGAGSAGCLMTGGNGEPNAITGSTVIRAGGGGGGGTPGGVAGQAGPGGGGTGGDGGGVATNATINTGSGGGGVGSNYGPGGGGSGGSGIVIIRYKFQN
jgi:hypothetical protein